MNDRGMPPQARIFDKRIADISRKFLADFSECLPTKDWLRIQATSACFRRVACARLPSTDEAG
jgi:hypothetical protein